VAQGGGGVKYGNYNCCCHANDDICFDGHRLEQAVIQNTSMPHWGRVCKGEMRVHDKLRLSLLIINLMCISGAIILAIIVRRKRTAAHVCILIELFIIHNLATTIRRTWLGTNGIIPHWRRSTLFHCTL
jgi:hypothetical protein